MDAESRLLQTALLDNADIYLFICLYVYFDYMILILASRFRNLSLSGMLSFSPDFKEQIVYLSEGWPSHAG
jgi:hypothetical protein